MSFVSVVSMAPIVAVNGIKMTTTTRAYLEISPVKEAKALTTELCRLFYNLGQVCGTGGSITMKLQDNSIPKSQQPIIVSPSGVQKERRSPEDMCVLSSDGSTVTSPYPQKPRRRSDCSPLFMKIEPYPKSTAVLVRNHDVYVWRDSWISAKTQDWNTPTYGPIRSFKGFPYTDESRTVSTKAGNSDLNPVQPSRRCIVLDIEGTTTPISFVTDVLFPYARDNVGRHLSLTYDSPETQDDIKLLRAQVEEDLDAGVAGAVPIPPDEEGNDKVVSALVANVEAMIKADRKITALKQLQGHVWRTGFQNKELEAVVFEDVPEALEKWHASGIKVYIYSSGSRLAQRLIFGNTSFGDLRKYLSGFFDTKVGNKRETCSYVEIAESVGVDNPSEILFVTDVYQEATAAKAAGMEVIISVRPGNGPLPENHGFKTVNSFAQI